jgi:hypothetical protein
MSVGVMEDYKLRDLRASHTLCWWFSKFQFFYLFLFSFFHGQLVALICLTY